MKCLALWLLSFTSNLWLSYCSHLFFLLASSHSKLGRFKLDISDIYLWEFRAKFTVILLPRSDGCVITTWAPSVASLSTHPRSHCFMPLFLTCPSNQSAGQLSQGETIVFINERLLARLCLFHLALHQSGYLRLHYRQVRHEKQKSAAPPGATTPSGERQLLWYFTDISDQVNQLPPQSTFHQGAIYF